MLTFLIASLITTTALHPAHLDAKVFTGHEASVSPEQVSSFSSKAVGTDVPKVLIWRDKGGTVKGLFNSQTQITDVSLKQGDSLEVVAASDLDTGQAGQELASSMFEKAKQQACGFTPNPETVSLTFDTLHAWSAKIEVIWRAAELCGPGDEQGSEREPAEHQSTRAITRPLTPVLD